MLSSVGDFQGQLDRISVDGTTETPNFSLDTANHPMPLHTRFHAVVDGITGDTYLEPVDATLRNSSFTTSGSVINIKGRGHIIELGRLCSPGPDSGLSRPRRQDAAGRPDGYHRHQD